MDLTKDTLWVLGDSFCDSRWSAIVSAYLTPSEKYPSPKHVKLYNYAEGSMDTQSILDNWIKLLPYMKENDAIVVCVSDISRTRFPMKLEYVYTLPHTPNPHFAPEINSYFRYAPVGYDPALETSKSYKLDVPFSDMGKFRDFSKLENSILATSSYDNSKKDIIEALYKITPCHKKFIYNWTDDDILKSDYIHSKDWITENIMNGNWETQHQQWISSNGESGVRYDWHLSDGCEQLMADYFIKEFEL